MKKYTKKILAMQALYNNNNSFGICISYPFAESNVVLTWNDIYYGIKYEYFADSVVFEFVMSRFEKNTICDDIEYELLYAGRDEKNHEELLTDIHNILGEKLTDENQSLAETKVLYLLLKGLYEQRNEFEDVRYVIDGIFDDFGFPDKIAKLWSNTPIDPSFTGDYQARFLNDWEMCIKQLKEEIEKP